jgi:hypothetical protein
MKKRTDWLLMRVFVVVGLCWVSPLLAEVRLEVLNPRGEIKPPPTLAPAPRVTDLAGKKIGIYWNNKAGGNNFWDVIEELLREKFPTAKILRYEGPFDLGDRLAATLAKEVDTFVYGIGD